MNKKILTLIIVFIILIILSLKTFSQSYLELESNIDKERTQYIAEIEQQLVSRANEIRNDINSSLYFASFILEKDPPTSFEEVKLKYGQINPSLNNFKYILVSNKGICYDINGSIFELDDKDLLEKIVIQKENISSFEKLTNGDNYLITTKALKPFLIDDKTIVSIMIILNEKLYREKMTLTLFNGLGMSFLCDKQGKILINPKYDKYSMMGYNLIASLKELNVKTNIINEIISDLKNGKSNYKYFQIEERWLIQYASFNNGEEFIISLIPVSIVSNDLIKNVSHTVQMAYIALFFILIIILILVLIIFNIITESDKNKFESNIREKEALNRSDFLSQMSHDMRTPLSAIVGMSKIAKEKINNEKTLIESIDNINSSANYLLEIINDVLDLSKLESGRLKLNYKPFSLDELINTVEAINQPKAKAKELFFKFNKNINPKICYNGDKLRITQILMNLISNAIKFTPENGYVNISINTKEINKKVDQLTFVIEDSGIGMSEDFIKNIFTPYVQENLNISSIYGGTGLGLSIVDNLVKMMKGTIKVKSNKGYGSTFIVDLKLQKIKNNIQKNNDKIKNFDFSKLNVLFIEDHKINRLIGEKQLFSLGINRVDSVENGKMGIEYFNKKPVGFYSFVLTDIRMPIIDGYQVINSIRTSNRADSLIPIIVLSANTKDIEIKSEYKINATLCKPVDIDELRKTICSII